MVLKVFQVKWAQEELLVHQASQQRTNGTAGQGTMATLVWLVFRVRLVQKASQVSTVKTDLKATTVFLESTVSQERLELTVSAVIKVLKALWDLMDMLVSQESTVLMVLEVKLAVRDHEGSLVTAARMEIPAKQDYLDRPDRITSLAKATVKVLSPESKEFEVMLAKEEDKVKKELEEKSAKIILTSVNRVSSEKQARLEDEEQEEKVKIADLFLRNIHRYEKLS